MEAPGADPQALVEQNRQLREQLLGLQGQVQALAQGQRGDRGPQQPFERRRFLEAPTLGEPDDGRVYLIPSRLPRGLNAHRLPTDAAGAQGEPHLLNVTSEHVYLHAVEKGKKHDSTVLRILLSLLAYTEVLESGTAELRERALRAEALTEDLREAVAAQLRPLPELAEDAPAADREAAGEAAQQRTALLDRITSVDEAVTLTAELAARAAGTAEGVSSIVAYGEGLQRTYLAPDHLVPHFLRLAIEASESIAAHVDTSSAALNKQVSSFRQLYAEKAAKLAAERAAGFAAGGGAPAAGKESQAKELKKLKAELAKLRKTNP